VASVAAAAGNRIGLSRYGARPGAGLLAAGPGRISSILRVSSASSSGLSQRTPPVGRL